VRSAANAISDRVDRDRLCERAQPGERDDPVAYREAAALRRRAHDAGGLRPGDERQLGLDLVLAPALQHLREGHACDVHVDEQVLGPRRGLGQVDDLDR
jgi:hypothetical protein